MTAPTTLRKKVQAIYDVERRKMARIGIEGPISEGSLRPQDLLMRFATTLEQLSDSSEEELWDLTSEATHLAEQIDRGNLDPTEDKVAGMIDALMNELDTKAQSMTPRCYFGSHPSDGACFGFWQEKGQ